MRTIFSALALLATVCRSASAAATNDAAVIAPFVNQQTIAVVHADLTQVNFDALDKWVEQVLDQSKLDDEDRKSMANNLHQATQEARRWTAEFNQAGGNVVWVVFTLENYPPSPPMFIVAPLEKGTDPAGLTKVFAAKGYSVAQIHDALLITPPGSGAQRFRNIRPEPRPDLDKALAQAGAGSLQVALIPSTAARKIFETMAPPLPDGQSATVLSRGILWGGGAVKLPPDLSIQLVVQSQDNAAAQDLLKLLNYFAAAAHQQNNGDYNKISLLRAAAALADRAKVQGDRLIISLDQAHATEVALDAGNSLRGASEQTQRIRSASNIRQLLQGWMMYANENKGAAPNSLEQLQKAEDMSDAVLVDPRHPQMKPGYVYIKPPNVPDPGIAHPDEWIVIYERFNHFGEGINVGFADGHVEWISDEKQFNQMLQKAQRPAQPGAK